MPHFTLETHCVIDFMLCPPVPGIGMYCGACCMSFPTSFPMSKIGLTACSVIWSALSAAMTAIQRMTSARTFIIIVPIIPFPMSSAPLRPCVVPSVRSPMVLNVTPQKVNVLVWLATSAFISIPVAHFVVPLLPDVPVAFIAVPRNMSPKASAADTYTGTIARDIKCVTEK